jgi:hypothetical protein
MTSRYQLHQTDNKELKIKSAVRSAAVSMLMLKLYVSTQIAFVRKATNGTLLGQRARGVVAEHSLWF